MYAFPSLKEVYDAWRTHIQERGATVHLSTEVRQVVHRMKGNKGGVAIRYSKARCGDSDTDSDVVESFDELILAVDADSCLKILQGQATWKEKKILGNVKYFWDISVTHYDREYMEKVRSPSLRLHILDVR